MPEQHNTSDTHNSARLTPSPGLQSGETSLSKRLAILVFSSAVSLALSMAACDNLVTEQVVIVVAGNPTAEFVADVDSGCAPMTVNFLDKSSGPHDQWLWKFGDGDSSTDTTPSHIYTTPGTYNVSLKITDNDSVPGASDNEFKKRFIVVGSSIAGFTTDTSGGCVGTAIQFTPSFSGITSFKWDFGDGSISTDTFPIHTFGAVGDFPVTFSVVGGCGVDSAYDTVRIRDCPTFTLTVDSATTCLGSSVRFTSSQNDTVPRISYTWDYGDGVIITNDSNVTSHTYADSGVFTVKLTVLSTDSVAFTDSVVNIVQVFDTLLADFAVSSSPFACKSPTGQFSVLFTDKSRGVITNRVWDFGDGILDTTNNPAPVHAYINPGQFNVTLKVFGPCGILPSDTLTKIKVITLAGALTAGITYTTPANNIFDFADFSTGVPSSWEWNFGDNTTGTGETVSHTYTVADSTVDTPFIVTLKVKNSCSSDSSIVIDTVIVLGI